MVLFPVRKCYYIAKVSLLIILVVTIIGLFEKWRGGKRAASAYLDPMEEEYEKQILEDEARIIPGLGEGGAAAYLTGEDKKRGEESEKKLAMNVYLSDRIAYNRTLADKRNPGCARVVYDAELPSASVILIFHNEPYSVVVRTIWSVINSCRRDQPWFKKANFIDKYGKTMKLGYPGQDPSSPLIYLKEIILVDDNSTLLELKGKLSHYVRTRLPPDLIRILRLPERQGLITARMVGARAARGDVLVFLDAHCEPEADWLRPLLQRITNKRDDVVTPVIDVIDQGTFKLEAADVFQVGGFTFTGHFTWIDVPEREKKRRGSDISPTWSPTMAGGLFAINRAYYWELGAYDEQMAGWGGENLEMSFRIWQCGGTLETVPCSRVGHVFRSFHPYSMPANSDTHGINTARMAEVWMDDFAELFYLYRPDLRKNPKIGDVTHRKVLREKLQCKSFDWFLDNVYQEKYVPVRDAYAYGRFMNPSSGLCIDNMQRDEAEAPLGLYPCHPALQATQYLTLSLSHQLRDEEQCAHVLRTPSDEEESGRRVYMANCHGKLREQKWQYLPSTQQIQHSESGLCLDAALGSGQDLLAKPCRATHSQKWNIDYSEENDFKLANAIEATEQEVILRRLRGQRRKSRSLLSYAQQSAQRRRRHRHHKRSKNRTKNKFILKLVRTLMNSSEDHLEVDIHCKHKQLYPNNTFVRDLVTILNERNIKVINNGRVFERNKVTQLDQRDDEDRKVLHKMDVGDPMEVRTVKKSHKRKQISKLIPTVNANVERTVTRSPARAHEPANAYELTANVSESTSAAPRSHRIIIEDFIEMTPSSRARTKRMKRRRRKRVTTPAPAPPPPQEQDNNILELLTQNLASKVEEQITVSPNSEERESMEDSPMVSQSETAIHPRTTQPDNVQKEKERQRKRDKEIAKKINDKRERDRQREKERTEVIAFDDDNDIHEVWPIGESRFRGLVSRRRHGRVDKSTLDSTHDEDSTVEGAGVAGVAGGAPVKVVMRSNLTFNLADEFFKWRAKDDLPDSELSIPKARETPSQVWRLHGDSSTAAPAPDRGREGDDTAPGHVRNDTEERSSSSDSASGE